MRSNAHLEIVRNLHVAHEHCMKLVNHINRQLSFVLIDVK